MQDKTPTPLPADELRSRLRRIRLTAKKLGFQGKVEYRHVFSGTGGAQYGIASTVKDDLLVVFAEAFQRDANTEDFSLEAILAHERGHQLLVRHSAFASILAKGVGLAAEEILASLIGSLLAESEADREALYLKALHDAMTHGMEATNAIRVLHELRDLLEKAL